jgi:hypothetical protein
MTLLRLIAAIAAILLLSSGSAAAYQYKSARALYRDCAAGVAAATADGQIKRNRCADYLDRVFDSWVLAQRSGVCSQHNRAELPKAYVEYWREKGLGLSGRVRSPFASVKEFLDSQSRQC